MANLGRLICTALILTIVIFLEIIACVLSKSGILAITFIPLFLMPVPFVLLRCCGGGDAFSDGPRWRHWAEFWAAVFFTSTIAIPLLLYSTGLIIASSLVLSLAGILVTVLSVLLAAFIQIREEEGAYSSW